MKQTYTGKELDVLYYFGDSNQPGFSISAYHLYNSKSQYADFSVNEQGELIVNTVHSSPSTVYNKISINADGYLVVDGTSTGLVSETSDGSTVIDNAAVVTALHVSFYMNKKNILPITAGYSVDLLSVVNDSSYISTGTGYADLYKYPDCIEGISLIFRDRLDWVKATITVVIENAGTFRLTRKWAKTKTIGALFEEIEVGLSQVKRSRIQSVRITIDEMSVSTVDLVSLYAGLVLTFNNERHLKNLNIHQDMPNDDGILSGGLCLAQGSIQLDDSDKYLLRLLVMYEYRGIMGTRGRYFNDFFQDEKGELIFEEGYYPEPFPIFKVEDGDIELTSSLMADFITYENGNIYADYEGAPDNLINKKKHLVEVYLEGHKPLYKLQVSEFNYNNTQYKATVTLEDILNRLDEIKIDALTITNYSSTQKPFTDIISSLLYKTALQGFYVGKDLYCNNPSKLELEENRLYWVFPRNTTINVAVEMSAKAILEGLAASYGLLVYLKPYFEPNVIRQSSSIDSFTEPYISDFFLMIKPCLEDIGQVHSMDRAYSQQPRRYNYNKESYVMIDSAIIGAVTRSVIKPNYISKVIGSYFGWNSENQQFDTGLETTYEIGRGNNPFNVKDNSYVYWDSTNNYGVTIYNSVYQYSSFYDYFANYLIDKYVFGLDTVEFEAILSKKYGNEQSVCPIVFNIGERFTIDFSRTEIPTNYHYQIISTTLNYDGELTFNLVGMQC